MHDSSFDAKSRPRGNTGLWAGALLWALFALAVVLLRGVRWDENYEFAQCLTRIVPYPEEHPLFRYTRGAFSFQTYSLAGLLLLTGDAAIVNGFRNILFMAATVLPPYLLTAYVTRRALWSHAAVILVLLGVHLELDSSYPQFIWPDIFSNGHIGMGLALITLFLIAAGYRRAGFLLLGLMPCLHLGQAPPVYLFSGAYGLWAWRKEGRGFLRRVAPWFAAGAAFTAAFWLFQRQFVVPPPGSGPYHTDVDPLAVWRAYTSRADLHRNLPNMNSVMALAGMLLLGATAAAGEWRRRRAPSPMAWLFLYACSVAAIVCSIMAVHLAMGPFIPRILIGWMPYRLLNHIPMLLIVFIVVVLNARRTTGWLIPLTLLYGLVTELLRPALMEWPLFARYLSIQGFALFALYGAAAAVSLAQGARRQQCRSGGVFILALLVMAYYHQFGAACVAAGALAGIALLAAEAQRPVVTDVLERLARPAFTGALCVAVLTLLTFREWQHREHLPRTPFEVEVVRELAERGESDAMLIGPPYQIQLQARTGHPVMCDMAMPTWLSYMPSIIPGVVNIYGEIYGIRWTLRPPDPPNPHWHDVWRERTAEEWARIGGVFDTRYLIAPAGVPLQLPQAVSGEHATLYEIAKQGE